jgi:hypothetical protein
VLDDERREAFLQALDTLREEQAEAERREEDERLKREEAIRRDIEEARRLRAENEARERKRLEEERVKREGEERERVERAEREVRAKKAAAGAATEGDFGVEGSPAPPSVAARSKSSGQSSSSSSGARGAAKPRGALSRRGNAAGGGNAVAAPTIMSRASTVLNNLQALVHEIAGAFQTNPYVLLRMLAFVIGILLLVSRKKLRERIARVIGVAWGKVKATAGMGTKVSYI